MSNAAAEGIPITLFGTATLVLFFLIQVLSDFTIGFVVSGLMYSLVYRSHFSWRQALRAALFGALASILISVIAGCAGLHAEFNNGQRVAWSSWGEDMRPRNFLADHRLSLAVVGSSLAALLSGVSRRREA